MQVNGPFEKQQDTSARLVCQAIRDLRPHLETQVSLPGPAGDQTSGIMHTPACRCAGPPSSGTVPSWGTRGGGGGWLDGRPPHASSVPPTMRCRRAGIEAVRPTPRGGGGRSRVPGVLCPAPRSPHPRRRLRSSARPLASGAPRRLAPPRGPSALEDQ